MRYQLPALSNEALADNKAKASEARARYAKAKRDLKHGKRTLESVLDDPSLARVRVHDVIRSLPGVGSAGAEKIIKRVGVAPSRRIGGLGCRQREALLEIAGGQ